MVKKVKGASALLEIGTEEIPARFMPSFLEDLKDKAKKELECARLKFSGIKTFGTARRLLLYVEGLSSKQDDIVEEKKGPPKERAFDAQGKPTEAAKGFAKSLGLEIKDLTTRGIAGKEYVFATLKVKGLPAEKVLSQVFPKIITSLYLPLSMKWGSGDLKFIRPIHWVLAIYGSKVINFELAGIKSSNTTLGHRYVSGTKPIKIKTPTDLSTFEAILSKNGVILDQVKRKEWIKKEVKAAAKRAKGQALIEDDLLEEVTYLVEYPVGAVGRFDPRYIDLPKDILITTMKKNQKYFPIIDSDGNLKPAFVIIADCPKRSIAESTAEGNERVLSARLSDAKFFFDEDKKIPLKSRVEELKKVAFYEKLGTVYDKISRIMELSLWLSKELKIKETEKANIRRVAELCKADLVTKMVFEFTELQGIMGREYALASGEDKSVANGIFEHYLPRYSGDSLPTSVPGTIVSLADKLDSIVGCFSVGLIPSGSEDPYTLRRQAHGIVEIILGKKLPVSLENATDKAYKLYEPIFLEHLLKKGETGYKNFSGIRRAVLEFISLRLRAIMLSEGVRYDVADASLASFSDVTFAYEKAKLIMKYLGSELLRGIIMTSDRVSRIARSAAKEQVIESDFIEKEEKSLYELYLKVNWEVGSAIDSGKIEQALKELGRITKPVDEFFEKILVMHKDERIKVNRLALLKSIELMYLSVADFPKILLQKSG